METNKATIINYKAHLEATKQIPKCTGLEHLSGNTYYVKYNRRTREGAKYAVFMLDHRGKLAYKQYPDKGFVERFKQIDEELRTEYQATLAPMLDALYHFTETN